MRELAALDLESTESQLAEAVDKLEAALLPRDPTSALGCLLEIKAGVGGSEASIFAADLMRMYSRFASSKKWKSEIINASAVSASTGAAGGTDAFREVILEIDGEGAYGLLKYEAGVHRVQRVPATESQGRVHTSTASIVVSAERSPYKNYIKVTVNRYSLFRIRYCLPRQVKTLRWTKSLTRKTSKWKSCVLVALVDR